MTWLVELVGFELMVGTLELLLVAIPAGVGLLVVVFVISEAWRFVARRGWSRG